jgi:hypothetical protein
MKKKLSVIVIVIVIVLFSTAVYFYEQGKPTQNITFGITFSTSYAASLGFDPKQMFLDMMADLKPKKIRLMAYWEEIEPSQGKFDFQNLDELLIEAGKENVDVILAVGRKLPRWPECHQPDWYNNLDASAKQEAQDTMVKTTVEHLKQFEAIKAWQVENEPYFVFGINCPIQSQDSVSQEVQLVKSLDNRPIILTASGEQGNWNQTARSGADIVGVTMYRTVYNDKLGYYKYPLGPWFYRIKAGIERTFEGKPVIGVELQAEPWLLSGIFNTDLDTQRSLMNAKVFQSNASFAKQAGLADNYLWGVEWWYWLARKQNDWTMWTVAKDLLNNQ